MGFQFPVKTSFPKSSPQSPGASAPDGSPDSHIQTPPSPRSPALSSASTADGEGSPELPPLPAPKLPDRVLGLLRTPPPSRGDRADQDRYDTARWGSPYPEHLRDESLSSGPSEESPIRHLEIHTPFLRPAPLIQESGSELQPSSLVSAAVLANRARRPARGLTEDWIRQHTAGDEDSERRHWLSDGAGDSENSSLSGSFSGDDSAWLGDQDIRTPRASLLDKGRQRHASRRYPRTRSSSETLKQAHLRRQSESSAAAMAATEKDAAADGVDDQKSQRPNQEQDAYPPSAGTPKKEDRVGLDGPADAPKGENNPPVTPSRAPMKRLPAMTPRLKKRVPWKGKNIMILLPRDEERGQPDKAPLPLSEATVAGMLKDWEQLGYNIEGFDLDTPQGFAAPGEDSQSRGAWPDFEDIAKERAQRTYHVLLPDLNAWRKYVEELNEAKLRALGVSFGDEDPPPPSISPATTMSRQPSVTHYPPLPFSPPIPTSSASSNHAAQGFPFPGQFVSGTGSSAAQSPGIPTVSSPASFGGKYNPRASVSIPSPHGQAWSPQMLLQQGGLPRGGSPSLANLNSMMSPTSPFSPDGMSGPVHQRHQSLQYPLLPHQFQQPARVSPRLQELREVEEEASSKSPSKTPEPTEHVRHNTSDSLQKEIDEAEYHLEEQMRSQLDNDEDYSPHNEDGKVEPVSVTAPLPGIHGRDPSVQFGPQPTRFGSDSEGGPVLHHPRPHSRGHSLTQKYFTEEDATKEVAFNPKPLQAAENRISEDSEVETNPSNLGTPIQSMGFDKLLHQRSFSTASNPWTDNESAKSTGNFSFNGKRRTSHGSKASLSKLNVEAPEFKFNPTNTFKPGQFVFSGQNIQPIAFPVGVSAPLSANSSQFSFPTTSSSKINVNAPAFSPGQTDFSFSVTGPKFRPDAPAFTPLHALSDSITSPVVSGNESVSNPASSIFGNIDINNADIVKPAKKSKAIPIIRPSSRHSQQASEPQEDQDGRLTDESRIKRARGSNMEDDAVPLFAQPTEESTPVPEPKTEEADEGEVSAVDKSFDETSAPADTAFSSTMVSETTDTRATVSPSETSPAQGALNWAPFEFKDHIDIQNFDAARPFGEDVFKKTHKKSLSAAAKAFVPGAPVWDDFGEGSAGESIDEPLGEPVEEPVEETVEEETEALEEEPVRESTKVPEEAPIEIKPTPLSASVPPFQPRGLQASRFASPPPAPKGLSASRFAVTPSPPPAQPADQSRSVSPSPARGDETEELLPAASPLDADDTQQSLPLPTDDNDLPRVSGDENEAEEGVDTQEPTYDDIDAIMRHLNQNPSMGVKKTVDQPQWHQPSPQRPISLAAVTNASPLHLPPQTTQLRSDAPSPSPRQYRALPGEVPPPILTTELEDPFVDPPRSALQSASLDGPVHRLNGSGSVPASDWDGAFTEDEQAKLETRVNFFDGHVNELVDSLLASHLVPLERTLDSIKHAVATMSRRTPSSRRERRSMSVEIQESDADDEDEELPVPRRSMSPRRDKRVEQIRAAVLDAFAVQQRNIPAQISPPPAPQAADDSSILRALEEMREQFTQSLHLDFRGEDLRNIVEDAVERRMPLTPVPTEGDQEKIAELQARVNELEQRVRLEETKVEAEVTARRTAEDSAADLNRKLEFAETRIEVEIMNKSAFDQRVNDLEDRLHQQQAKSEEELQARRAAEDRLSEVQRLLRIASEEESRLRELVEERDQKIKSTEANQSKSAMRLTLLEAAHSNAQQSQGELQNRINVAEVDLRDARQEASHWRSEYDRLDETSRRQEDDLAHVLGENRAMRKLVDTLGTQLQENEKIRDSWRSKFSTLQEDMAKAAHEIAEENARRTKREQALIARQEVLDAKLQAEARTRERIEEEMQRLENGERQGMRAVNESKRLEATLVELRSENHKLHQSALRYQAEFQEARESGAREVQRTRESMQTELDEANHQVNVVREELEDQIARFRAKLDQVNLDADTARARHEMLLEEAQSSKKVELEELTRRHQNDMEDMQARYERQLNNTTEDAQRSEQNLLERLSISASKSEHLQDKVAHLEEKLEIAKEAALAAAQAAKSSIGSPDLTPRPVPVRASKPISSAMEPPEKVSPQALRESIMVLQEQLQEREQKIEELEQVLSKVDPEASIKIVKRDDEIIWLRELLAVRHSDLQDIIAALQREDYDKNAVKDAAIRLKANLQMEEQERERAMNGGSAINLPNIASTIRDAASPRVAQAVGPLAAAWGNWRKSRDPNSFGSLSSVLSSPAPGTGTSSTPSRSSPASQSSFLGGLLTPPASGLRQSPLAETPAAAPSQPTAFSNTGRRFTAQQLANRPRGPSLTPRQSEKQPAVVAGTPSRRRVSGQQPVTPPMMRPSAYDSDAQAEDFDSAGFFDD